MSRNPRVGLDVRMAGGSGVGTYVSALLDRLSRHPELTVVPVFASGRTYSLREQLTVPLRSVGLDLFHAPHYNAPLAVPCPLVVTIHDLAHLALPGIFRGVAMQAYARSMLRAALARARRVITGSEHSRRDLVERLGADPARIRVAYHGVDQRFTPRTGGDGSRRVVGELGVDRPFVLYVGNVKPHKNIGGLIDAFERVASDDLALVIAGERERFRVADGGLEARIDRSPARDRIQPLGRVDDDQLLALYRSAHLLVMPSLYEGFGLPALEAMACGTPVVTSDRTSLPEVVGDAALLADPTDPDALGAALTRVAEDDALRSCLIDRGLRRARRFTWEASAAVHAETYLEALGLR